MKSMKKLVLVGLVLLASVMVLAGCDTNAGDSSSGADAPTQQPTGDGSGKTETPKFTVTFNTDGGSAVDSQSVESGKMATKPEDPTLEGSWFLGWYGDKELTKEFDFTSPITNDTEVYAKWSYKFHAKPKILTGYTSPNNTNNTWTYVAFGDWPQTIKASDVTVDKSKSKQMGMFTYYLGSDGNYYVEHKSEYYNVEPIVWRVLNKDYASTGQALLLAEKILTGGIRYYVDLNKRTIAGAKEGESDTVYPNNYKYSTIRAWLNGLDVVKSDSENDSTYKDKGFLQTAFTTSAQNLIEETTVDNSKESTFGRGETGGDNPYVCTNTSDKIFLLSEREATTAGYGFVEYNEYGEGNTRIRVTTDYAQATGAYQDGTAGYGGWWWLRSPNYHNESVACIINIDGLATYSSIVEDASVGVVPALYIELQ